MKSAVIDMGSARTKITSAEKISDSDYRFSSTSFDTALAGLINDGNLEEAQIAVHETIRQAKQKISNENIDNHIFLGTQIFRENPVLVQTAKSVLDDFRILTPQEEAVFFYRGIELEENRQDFWALDIGGGSIQLVWSNTLQDNISLPCGTYALEKKFQADKFTAIGPSRSEWKQMVEEVSELLQNIPFHSSKDKKLIIGSSIMRNFFDSAIGKPVFDLTDVETLSRKLDGKFYEETYPFFSSNNGFMHGADKLLAVLTAILAKGQFKTISATNCSLSKALCRILLEDVK